MLGPGMGTGSGGADAAPAIQHDVVGRLALLATAGFTFWSGFEIYAAVSISHFAVLAVFALYLTALSCLVLAFVLREAGGRLAQLIVAFALLVSIVAVATYQIRVASQTYGTDSIAFNHAAAEMVARGDNPYEVVGVSLEPVTSRFGVPASFVTRTTDGDAITRLMSYPALHVLIYVPFVGAGLGDMRWVTLGFEVATLALIWLFLPALWRFLAPLALLAERNLPIYFTVGGVTDWLWVLPVSVSALALRHRHFAVAGIALGLACAIKQQPWFAVPFVMVWVAQEAGSENPRTYWLTLARFVGCLGGAFLLPNLPFIVLDPSAWAAGVLQPALDNTVPDGQGLSILSSRGLVALPAEFYTACLVLALALALFVYTAWFHRLGLALWVLPAVVMWVSYRSFQNYFIYWIPISVLWLGLHAEAFAAARHLSPVPRLAMPPALKTVLLSALALGAVAGAAGLTAVAVADRSVELAVAVEDPTALGGLVSELNVEVTNNSPVGVDVVFNIAWGGYPAPWEVIGGDSLVAADASRRFRIRAPDARALPTLRYDDHGLLVASPFRVRVNVRGGSSFFVSAVVTPKPEEGLVNPGLSYWPLVDGADGVSAPLGWTVSRLDRGMTATRLGPLEDGTGVRLEAATEGNSGSSPWVEIGVLQATTSLERCYAFEALFQSDYVALGDSPAAATGLQVVQGQRFLWFVLSSSPTVKVTDLPPFTRIVQLPATYGVWSELTANIEQYGEDVGMELGQPAQVKLFNAIHESQSGRRLLSVRDIEVRVC